MNQNRPLLFTCHLRVFVFHLFFSPWFLSLSLSLSLSIFEVSSCNSFCCRCCCSCLSSICCHCYFLFCFVCQCAHFMFLCLCALLTTIRTANYSSQHNKTQATHNIRNYWLHFIYSIIAFCSPLLLRLRLRLLLHTGYCCLHFYFVWIFCFPSTHCCIYIYYSYERAHKPLYIYVYRIFR